MKFKKIIILGILMWMSNLGFSQGGFLTNGTPFSDSAYIVVQDWFAGGQVGNRKLYVKDIMSSGGGVTSVNGETGVVILDGTEIDLATPVDFDGDSTPETDVESALNALNGQHIMGSDLAQDANHTQTIGGFDQIWNSTAVSPLMHWDGGTGTIGMGAAPNSTARINSVGLGATNTTHALLLQNGSGTTAFTYSDDGRIRSRTASGGITWLDINPTALTVSMGGSANAGAINSMALGSSASTGAIEAIAIGRISVANGVQSTNIGAYSTTGGSIATSVGAYLQSSGSGTILIGSGQGQTNRLTNTVGGTIGFGIRSSTPTITGGGYNTSNTWTSVGTVITSGLNHSASVGDYVSLYDNTNSGIYLVTAVNTPTEFEVSVAPTYTSGTMYSVISTFPYYFDVSSGGVSGTGGGQSFFQVTKKGQLTAPLYGSGNWTGTATQYLTVDASGNIIETPFGAADQSIITNDLVQTTNRLQSLGGFDQTFDNGRFSVFGTSNTGTATQSFRAGNSDDEVILQVNDNNSVFINGNTSANNDMFRISNSNWTGTGFDAYLSVQGLSYLDAFEVLRAANQNRMFDGRIRFRDDWAIQMTGNAKMVAGNTGNNVAAWDFTQESGATSNGGNNMITISSNYAATTAYTGTGTAGYDDIRLNSTINLTAGDVDQEYVGIRIQPIITELHGNLYGIFMGANNATQTFAPGTGQTNDYIGFGFEGFADFSSGATGAVRGFVFNPTITSPNDVVSLDLKSGRVLNEGGLSTPLGHIANTTVQVTNNDYAFTMTANTAAAQADLPASPNDGDTFKFKAKDTTNGCTINGNGNNIDGAATLALTIPDQPTELIYSATLGEWQVF